MLLVFVLSRLMLQHAVVQGAAVGVLARLCVWPVCVCIPLALFCRLWVVCGALSNVLSGCVLFPVAADTSFGTPNFSSR